MMEVLAADPALSAAVIATAAAAGIAGYLLLGPRPVRIPAQRRRPDRVPEPSPLQRAAAAATTTVDRVMRRRGTPAGASPLELAAIKMRPQDFFLLVLVGSLVGIAAGAVLGAHPLVVVLLAGVAPIGAKLGVSRRIAKRQKMFAAQLDDSLQLMASNLRAGHSLPQALASVAGEADSPTSEEFARVVNETRVGRDLGDALGLTAARMASDDFSWVTQAIAINREVGGNLAEVLNGVADTIRQRNEIRRQVATLSG